MRPYFITALMFGIVTALVRASLPFTKTRIQIGVMLVLALLFELFGRHRLDQQPRLTGFALNAAAVLLGASVVKIAIDGRPNYPEWMLQLAGLFGIPL